MTGIVDYTDEQKKDIAQYITEAVEETKTIAHCKEQIKDYAGTCKEIHGMLPKEFNALVKHHYEAWLDEKDEEITQLKELYDSLFTEQGVK